MQQIRQLPPKKDLNLGFKKKFVTNYYDIELYKNVPTLYQYCIFVTPELPENMTLTYRRLMESNKHEVDKHTGFLFARGRNIFGTKRKSNYEFTTTLWFEKQLKYDVQVKEVKTINLRECFRSRDPEWINIAIQTINSYTKSRLQSMGLKQLGKGRFFHRDQLQELPIAKRTSRYQYCRGFKFTVCPLNHGIYMQIDTISRVIRTRNFLQQIQANNPYVHQQTYRGFIVMARYGNFKTYTVVSLDFKKHPGTKFTPHGCRKQTTFREYAESNYQVHVTNFRQPMVVAIDNVKKQLKKGGKQLEVKTNLIYLIPQLICLTGIDEKDRSKGEMMRQIASNTKYGSNERMELIQEAKDDIDKKLDLISVGNRIEMNGYNLKEPYINGRVKQRSRNGTIHLKDIGFQEVFKDQKVWHVYYPDTHKNDNENYDYLEKFMHGFRDCADSFGIKIDEGFGIPVTGQMCFDVKGKFKEVKKKILFTIQQGSQRLKPHFIIFIIAHYYKEPFYNQIKCFCNELNIPSQFIQLNKLCQFFPKQKKRHAKKANPSSYLLNLLLQITTKSGNIPWSVSVERQYFKDKNLAIGSLAISKVKNEFTLAFVGTINKEQSKYYCQTRKSKNLKAVKDTIHSCFVNWIKEYFYLYEGKNIGCLPTQFVIYRQGLSRSDISKTVMPEFQALQEAIAVAKIRVRKRLQLNDEQINKYRPKIAWFTVNKKTSSRYYQRYNNKLVNPTAGSVIIDEMSMLGFTDFHLTAHLVDSTTTSCPTQFVLAHHNHPSNTRFPLEQFIQLSYEQCYNYYNWKGAIRFPASLQYADKLAKMASKYYEKEIDPKNPAKTKLYFL